MKKIIYTKNWILLKFQIDSQIHIQNSIKFREIIFYINQ